MRLTGLQRQQLHDALLSAFPDREALERLASFGLNVRLNLISRGNTYSAVVLSMIDHHENTIGQLEELIEAAQRMNPDNPELRDFYEHVWLPLKRQFEKKQNAQQHKTSATESEEKSESTYRDPSEKAHKEKQARSSNFIRAKSWYFGIDLNTSPDRGMILVCKYVLDGILHSLSTDPRKISIGYIDILEEDLREIRNEFELMSRQEARKLKDLKLVTSVSAIMVSINRAHIEICTATKMIENGSNVTNYIAYFNCLNECRKRINGALQYFLV